MRHIKKTSNFKIITAAQKACVRKLFDWNRGILVPRSFLPQTVCPQFTFKSTKRPSKGMLLHIESEHLLSSYMVWVFFFIRKLLISIVV